MERETNEIMPEVVQVVPGEGYSFYAYMTDGSIHLYDASPLIKKGNVFAPLADLKRFRETLTVMNGTAAWDLSGDRNPSDCIDIAPESIEEAPRVSDPLETAI